MVGAAEILFGGTPNGGTMNFANPLMRKVSANMDQRKGLGRGLSSLIPPSDTPSKKYLEVPLTDVLTNPNQPRKLFTKESIDELALSIEEKGILQPMLVRPLGGGKYELIAGERRFRAAKQVGLEKAPVVVHDIDANETLELALIENIQREDLNPIEEALAYKDLLSKCQYTQDELAKRLGKDRSSIANSLRLLKLPDKIRNQIIGSQISMGHARAILGIDDKDTQIQIAEDIIANVLSVRETENLIKKYKLAIADDAALPSMASAVISEEENTVSERVESGIIALMNRLKERLKAFVKIQGSSKKGKISIAYSSEEELNGIVEKLMR